MSLFAKASEPKDAEVVNPPLDSVSAVSWSPTADFLAVSSWSNEVRIYQVAGGGANQGSAMYRHEAPVLCVQWSKDGSKIVSGGADNAARLFDPVSQQAIQFGAHDAPIRCIEYIDAGGGIVCTGSWDKTVRYWDLRQPSPIAQVQLLDRCYTMSCVFPLLVVGTAERHIQIYDLNNPAVPFKSILSPLRFQTRSIACMLDAAGYAITGVEGRVAAQYVDDAKASSNFSFKTGREDLKPLPGAPFKSGSQKIWAVNTACFHPFGTLATAGSDGSMNIWDLNSRTRLKTFNNVGGPITSAAFSATGQYLAYAISYDWSKGFMGNTPSQPNKVMLHVCQEDEVKRRPPKK